MRIAILFTSMLLAIPAVRAIDTDLHWRWHDSCAACHGYAGDFARKFLSVSGGELQGVHHVNNLRLFLHNHYLADNEVDAIYNMMLAQATNQARFKNECASCHGTAADFVRSSLELRDGVLYSHDSARSVSSFLEHHRGLTSDDVEFYVNLLTRIAHEVFGHK